MATNADHGLERKGAGRSAALVAFLAGLGAAVAAGVALWASQGADVFLAQAFAALAACF